MRNVQQSRDSYTTITFPSCPGYIWRSHVSLHVCILSVIQRTHVCSCYVFFTVQCYVHVRVMYSLLHNSYVSIRVRPYVLFSAQWSRVYSSCSLSNVQCNVSVRVMYSIMYNVTCLFETYTI